MAQSKEDKEECPCGNKHPPSTQSSKPASKRATRSSKNTSDPKSTEKVSDYWLECDYCYQWWHKECAGVLRPKGIEVDITDFSCILCLLAHSSIPSHVFVSQDNQPNCQTQELIKDSKQKTSKKKKSANATKLTQKDKDQENQTTTGNSPITEDILSEYEIINTTTDTTICTNKQPSSATTNTQQNQPPSEKIEKEEEFVVLIDNIDSPFHSSVDIKREVRKFYPEVEIKHCYPLPKGGIALHTTSLDFQNTLLSEWPPGAFRTPHKVKSHKPLSLSTKATLIVKSVPTFLSTEELQQDIESSYNVQVSIKRLKYRNNRLNRPIIKITSDRKIIQTWQKNGIALNKRLYPCEPIQKDKPIRCFNCQRFGHIAKFCRSEKRCERCSQKHSILDCPNTFQKCCNCSQEHSASSLNCPQYISRSQEIIKRRGVERQFQTNHL